MYQNQPQLAEIQQNQQLQDEFDTTRTLFGAALINEGAVYSNGVLTPLDRQVASLVLEEVFADGHDQASRSALLESIVSRYTPFLQARNVTVEDGEILAPGREIDGKASLPVVLYGPTDRHADKTLADYVDEHENTANLQRLIAETVEPYSATFDSCLPDPRSNRRGMFGGLKQAEPIRWDAIIPLPHGEAPYNFFVDYEAGETVNKVKYVSIRSEMLGFNLTLNYDESRLSQIHLQMGEKLANNTAAREDLFGKEQNEIGRWLECLGTCWGTPHMPLVSLGIYLTPDSPSMYFGTPGKVGGQYTFDAEANTFRVNGTELELPPERFCNLVGDVLGLVPARK